MKEPEFQPWEYILKTAIYRALISFDVAGSSIPCLTRTNIENRCLQLFNEGLKEHALEISNGKKQAIDFAQWYSGMDRQKVEAAYQRYLVEVKSLQ